MLKINNLTATIDSKPIINGISINVNPGEIHILMGPNGSGKTTIARTIVGFPEYSITKGSINLDGKSITSLSIDKRARLGLFMAFQYPVAVPGVSFRNFLRTALNAMTSRNEQLPLSKFTEFLEQRASQLEIPLKLLDRDLNQDLSGGEKKKMEILQLSILKPKYAILDEIDSGLDIDSSKTIYSAVNNLVKSDKKIGIIIITHYERILEYLTPDFVYILKNGEITERGSKDLVERISKHGFKAN